MGWYGVPSKACSNCRKRRIKCDLSIPSCGQCLRANVSCFGYRKLEDLLFHDQTEDVARRVHRTERKSRPRDADSLTMVHHVRSDRAPLQQLVLENSDIGCPNPRSFQESIENQAVCFFFNNYPSLPSNNVTCIYKGIPTIYYSESSHSPLLCIITALGLAALSHHTKQSDMKVAAGSWYNKALNKINRNLRCPELAKQDQTLLVVLLLGLYETITCTTPRSMKSWMNHTKGATALLYLRGEESLESEFGSALFKQTCMQIISGCYQTRMPVPDRIVQMLQRCRDRSSDAHDGLSLIVSRICEIRAEGPFNPLPTQSDSATRVTIARLTSIAQELIAWHEKLPSGFTPLTALANGGSSEILLEHYSIYEDIWTAYIINNYRANSILLHEALVNQLCFLRDHHLHGSDEIQEVNTQISYSRSMILSLIDAVCASVPNLLLSNYAVVGVGLLWTLYVSAQISPRTAPLRESTRTWIIGRLKKIGTEMGVGQATMLTELLHKNFDVTQVFLDGKL